MKLPNAEFAVVEPEKILDYLLNTEHRFGAAKARFFSQFGFDPNSWEVLAEALRQHGRRNDVIMVRETGGLRGTPICTDN